MEKVFTGNGQLKPAVVKIWLLVILLTAVFLRLHLLPTVPPGLTHDEADHGISAWGVVNGERPIYFTIGYGREPLYDYGTAVLMTFLGPTYVAGRLTAVFFSLILLASTYAWVRRAFDTQTALYTIAGLAVGFWPLMTARHMLRSITLPALFVLAVSRFWRTLPPRSSLFSLLFSAFLLGLTFYTYLPARALWLLFPLVAGYAAWIKRPFPHMWRKTAVLLLGAGLVGLPLFYYLYTHPGAEVRIGQLSEPLKAAWRGQWQLLGQNALAGAKILTIAGDPFERYNMPGQSLLPWWLGIFFYVGVVVAGWRVLRPQYNPSLAIASFFTLTWLAVGLAPALITGPRLSTTQTIGMQPVLYLLVAVGMREVVKWAGGQVGKWRSEGRGARSEKQHSQFTIYNSQFIIFPLFLLTAVFTYHRYFVVWANLPEVRVQYETTMVEAMRYLNESGEGVVGVSTITPGAVHSPAVAQMVLHNQAVSLRWFDGNHALVIPQNGRSTLIFPGFASPPPILSRYLDSAVLQQTLPLRPTDLDRPLTVYQIDGEAWLAKWMPVFKKYSVISAQYSVGEGAVEFLGYDLPTTNVQPGEAVQLVTLWRVIRPFPEAKLFVQLLQPEGSPITQDDRLDAPGYNWQPGDIFMQLHQLTIPPETAVGSYPLITGLYNSLTGERLPVLVENRVIPDHLDLQSITIQP